MTDINIINPTGIALFILCACSHPSPWAVDQVRSDQKAFSFVRLCYHSLDPVNGIDVEFTKNGTQVQACLLVHSKPLPVSEGNSISVSIRKKGAATLKCTALCLQGGQRLVLSADTTEQLIALLKGQEDITIHLPGYHSQLHPEDFEQKLETFLNPSSLRNPFQFSL